MIDTIDMLEAIGQDASLRYASGDDLVKDPAMAEASDALRAAVSTGDGSGLSAELGLRVMQATQVSQHPGREDEDEEPDQEEGDEPHPANSPPPGNI
jgi:hypothetical protein